MEIGAWESGCHSFKIPRTFRKDARAGLEHPDKEALHFFFSVYEIATEKASYATPFNLLTFKRKPITLRWELPLMTRLLCIQNNPGVF